MYKKIALGLVLILAAVFFSACTVDDLQNFKPAMEPDQLSASNEKPCFSIGETVRERIVDFTLGGYNKSMVTPPIHSHDLLTVVRDAREIVAIALYRNLQDLTARYDDDFFIDNALVLYIFTATDGGPRPMPNMLVADADILVIHLETLDNNGLAPAVITYWAIILEVSLADVNGITEVVIK